ncbi:MAG: hypothetical protein IAE82_11070 [Opitutaceae bacterium]|nr:hypothetical protein [Opitutaceae bacterium]
MAYLVGMAVLHPTIAHGITGPHGKELNASQLAMHTLSLCIFGLLLCAAQNQALRFLQPNRNLLRGWSVFLLVPVPFWLGYYALYIPFDILFTLLFIGGVNVFQIGPFVRSPRHWAWQIMLTMVASAACGIGGGVLMYLNVTKSMTGLGGDYLMWFAISAPAAFTSALLGRWFLRDQTRGAKSHTTSAAPSVVAAA